MVMRVDEARQQHLFAVADHRRSRIVPLNAANAPIAVITPSCCNTAPSSIAPSDAGPARA